MSTEFKEGERVVMYDCNGRNIVKITGIVSDERMWVEKRDENSTTSFVVHPKQCRKLKFKKKVSDYVKIPRWKIESLVLTALSVPSFSQDEVHTNQLVIEALAFNENLK